MRDNHTRRLFLRQNLVDRIVDPVFARRVQRARRLVECEDRRAFEQRAGDRETLPLSTAQAQSTDCVMQRIQCQPCPSVIVIVMVWYDSLSVSNPLGMPQTNSQLACRAACSISSRVAVALPNAMLDAIVPVNKTGS